MVVNATDVFTGLGAENAEGLKADETDGWHVADCLLGGAFSEELMVELPLKEARANAHLISAAPELYEALASIENDDESIPLTIWEMRNEALAKARGEQ
jgi:hypothetical protein